MHAVGDSLYVKVTLFGSPCTDGLCSSCWLCDTVQAYSTSYKQPHVGPSGHGLGARPGKGSSFSSHAVARQQQG